MTCLFLLAFLFMATQTGQQAVDDEISPADMTPEQAQAMFVGTFQDMDKNHDNQVDLREFMATYLVHDHDRDGEVTLAEFLQQAPAGENEETLSADSRFHDINHDDRITAAEMTAQFNTIDTDRNGEITKDEFVTYGTHLFEDRAHPAFQKPPVGK